MKRLIFLFAVLSISFSVNAETQVTQNQVKSTYRVGDYYNDGMKEGIVFEVTSGGKRGKIMSLNQSPLMPWTVCKADVPRLIGTSSADDGQYNQRVVEAIEDWQWKYPAFDWCAHLGEGWYLPSREELKSIYKNRKLLDTQLIDKISYSWSSTESDKPAGKGESCAWVVNLQTVYYAAKDIVQPVRAVAAFDTTRPVEVTGETYALGDYYDDGHKQGVVFEVDYFGKRGKIVSMITFDNMMWTSSDTEAKRCYDADDNSIGKYNMWKIWENPNWSEVYPLHNICTCLGPEWYIPAVDEMERILSLRYLLQMNLQYLFNKSYWTSVETTGFSSGYAAKNVYLKDKPVNSREGKKSSIAVVFVSMFDTTKPALQPKAKKYKIGDYYNDGKKEGVVFHVTDDGMHGKILSMTELDECQWAEKPDDESIIGAYNKADGAKNMQVVKSIDGWETKYPAFKWCADLGDGWYLPSTQELYKIYYTQTFTNQKLTTPLSPKGYWSSTEQRGVNIVGFPTAHRVSMDDGVVLPDEKNSGPAGHRVRAIAAF